MAAHRYWRISCTKNNSNGAHNYMGFMEIEFRASIGGATQCTGGTASASGVDAGNVAANAFDNNTSTVWYSNGSLPCWIMYDFGSGNSKDIVEFACKPVGPQVYCPNEFALQYSDDNSTWTTTISVKGETNWRGPGTFVAWSSDTRYDSGSSGQVWRVNMSAQQSGAATLGVASIQMRTTPGGPDQCSGGYPFASSMDNTINVGAFQAFDSNSITNWLACSNSFVPSWIGYKFSSAIALTEMAITAGGGGNQIYAPAAFTIEKWNGSSWDVVYTASGQSWSSGETKVFTWAAPTPTRPQVFICC